MHPCLIVQGECQPEMGAFARFLLTPASYLSLFFSYIRIRLWRSACCRTSLKPFFFKGSYFEKAIVLSPMGVERLSIDRRLAGHAVIAKPKQGAVLHDLSST